MNINVMATVTKLRVIFELFQRQWKKSHRGSGSKDDVDGGE